jgi:hypothetical protein
MSKCYDRCITWTAALTAVALVAGGAVLLRDRLVEAWHVHRLDSHDPAARQAALERLIELRSVAAVPYLIRAIQSDGRENACVWVSAREPGESRRRLRLTPAAHALFRIGPGALPALAKGIEENASRDPRTARILCEIERALASSTLVECVYSGGWGAGISGGTFQRVRKVQAPRT